MLAVQYGLTRFHQYVYGQMVTVETDHKPLLGIKQKPITDVSPRLQRMRLCCQPYDYNLMYKPGKVLVLADTLSRAYLANVIGQTDKLDTEQIWYCEVHRERRRWCTGQGTSIKSVTQSKAAWITNRIERQTQRCRCSHMKCQVTRIKW